MRRFSPAPCGILAAYAQAAVDQMKIVSVMTTTSSGGAEFAAVEMLHALAARGHEVVMLSDQPGIGRGTSVTVRPLHIGPKLSTTSWRALLRGTPRLAVRLRNALRREAPYDVLLLHYKKEQLFALTLPSALRSVLVWAEWGPVPFPLRKGLPRRLYLAAERHAAVTMAISAGTKQSMTDVGVDPKKIVVMPNVLRTDDVTFRADGRERVHRELGIPADAFVVGCISRFHPKKRNDVVIDAVARLDDPRAHLIMAGSGETETALRDLAGRLGVRAHFVPTPGDDLADVLSAFDVSVFCPSPTEGQPRAVILGMLASRPCLSTGPEGVADMIRPEFGGIASPENDPDALAALLAQYSDDPERRLEEGAAARRWAEETYAAPVVAERIERLWRSVGAR